MTACARFRRRFSDIFEGELEPKGLKEFHRHLDGCPTCRHDWEQFKGTMSALHDLPRASLSEFAGAKMRRELTRQLYFPQAESRRFPRSAGMAAAAMLLISFGFVIGQQAPPATDTLRILQALPDPDPEVRLRDSRTGGWMNVEDLASDILRKRRAYTLVPRVRAPLTSVAADLRRDHQEIVRGLTARGVGVDSVQFLAPVTVNESLLDGPEVEFWVQEASLDSYR